MVRIIITAGLEEAVSVPQVVLRMFYCTQPIIQTALNNIISELVECKFFDKL